MTKGRIIIAGGGTAGWMTAAAFGRFLSDSHAITLVESDAIGTIGVGEATIPQIMLFNAALGIDEREFLAATSATFKLGIEFDGWAAPGHRYMHAFGPIGRDAGLIQFHHYWLRAHALGVAKDFWAYSLNATAACAGKARIDAMASAATQSPLPRAYHFDAALYAAFLRRYAEHRGVSRVEGRIADVERDGESGDVTALVLDGERRLAGDLFIDATGLHALLIGKTLGVPYEHWNRWLPCDRAMAVPCDIDGPPLPYTRATAREAGWQWRIPLQHRIGNGIVYASDWLSDDAAATVLLANLDGAAQADPRPIRFETGRRADAWAHNVIAVGLSGGFLEPLESTSIHLIQSAISRLLKLLPNRQAEPHLRALFNRQTAAEYEGIRDFLILHYHRNNRPEPFWRAMRAMAVPESLSRRMAVFAERGEVYREQDELFTEHGWLQVMLGQGMMPSAYHPLADAIDPADLDEFLANIARRIDRDVAAMPTHASFFGSPRPVATQGA